MNKKQKNRKLVTQNKRNRIINRRYSSTIKTLIKLFRSKLKNYLSLDSQNQDEKDKYKIDLIKTLNLVTSILDKATKKKVIHKNSAARRKSIFQKLVNSI
jgi:small subunit ribosomal protein S20